MKPRSLAKGVRSTKPPAKTAPAVKPGGKKRVGEVLDVTPSRFHMRSILVPVDFSDHSQQSLRYARKFAEQFGASICLLHVVEPMIPEGDFGYAAMPPGNWEEERLEAARSELKNVATQLGASVPVECRVRLGRAWREITDLAQTHPADLLIVSTHGYTGLKYALLGSVAEKIVRHAPCPVLVVRPGEHEFA